MHPGWWLGLAAAAVLLYAGWRWFELRPWARRAWQRRAQAPLGEAELRALYAWERRNLAWFIAFAVVGAADAVLTALRWLSGSPAMILWLVFVLLGVAGLAHHFSGRCPRCQMRLGVQSNLLLPQRCARCRVELRRSKPGAS